MTEKTTKNAVKILRGSGFTVMELPREGWLYVGPVYYCTACEVTTPPLDAPSDGITACGRCGRQNTITEVPYD